MLLGLDLFHGEVGTLDEADLDGRSPRRVSRIRPGDEPSKGDMGIGDVGLQDDSRGEIVELRLIEDGDEGFDRQFKVAMLLHIEIDEGAVLACDAVEGSKPFRDPSEGVVPGECVQVGAECGDLDGDVVHIGTAYP